MIFFRYCDNKSFEMTEMDTDSAYLGIAGKTLLDIIHPEYIQCYKQKVLGLCDDNPYEADNETHIL